MEGLVLYYTLDGNTKDSGPNDINGVMNGSTVGATDRFGDENRALSFNGSNNFVNVANNPLLNITEAITISLWINPTSISTEGFTGLVNKWEYLPSIGQGVGYYLGLNPNGLSTRWNTGSISGNGQPIPLNEWTHILVTYDADLLKIYRNCNLEMSIPAVDTIRATSVPFRIGQQSEIIGAAQYFNGSMDELLVYNRALELSEIEDICSNFPTGITSVSKELKVNAFPNPFRDYLEITFEDNEYIRGELINTMGQSLRKFKVTSNNQRLATNDLSAGVYVLVLYKADGSRISKKTVKRE